MGDGGRILVVTVVWRVRKGKVWVSDGDLGLGGRVGVTYGGGVTSSAGRMWPAALLLRGNPVWVSVCVCVFGLCARAPWKMPPSAIHTSIEGANKGHTRTVSSLYVWVRVFPLSSFWQSRKKSRISHLLIITAPVKKTKKKNTSHCETFKSNPQRAQKAKRRQRRAILVPISSYFSARRSRIDREEAPKVSVLSALSVAKASGGFRNRGGQQ